MIPVPHQDLIDLSGQFEIISFKGLVSSALNRLQCLDIAAPDVRDPEAIFDTSLHKDRWPLKFPRLDFHLSMLVYIVRLSLYPVSVPAASVPPALVPPVLLPALLVAVLSSTSRMKKGTETKKSLGRELLFFANRFVISPL